MAYSSTNGPFMVSPPAIAGGAVAGSSDAGGNSWYYKSTHASSDVRVAGFISDARVRGMKVGDLCFVFASSGPTLSVNMVSVVSTAGATLILATS